MYTYETKITTRYAETDQMGIIYHANYITYYEIARTEMIRKLGYPYSKVEEEGIMMPVIDIQSKFISPAYYDEELSIKVTVKNMPSARIVFHYEIFNSKNNLINTGSATLAFMDSSTRKPCRPPLKMVEIFRQFFP